MAKKKILSVGAELAVDDVEYCDFDSDASLLDWDIVLFKPVINEFTSYADHYQGKPSLSDSSSFSLKERSEHWRREIKQKKGQVLFRGFRCYIFGMAKPPG